MTYHYLAFFMGLFGSVHCAVMCGPLLIAVQGDQTISWKQTWNKLLYQFGRIMTYGAIGLLLGALGNLAVVQGGQQFLSIFTGILLVILGVFYAFGTKSSTIARFQTRAVQPFVRMMGKWLYRPGGSIVAGVLNGILPCGMVYMALASAMNADGMVNSWFFMVLFGLGTLPLMLVFSFAANFSKQMLKGRFSRVLPFLYLLMGVWFILRGSNLDIPYLSPLIHVDGAVRCD